MQRMSSREVASLDPYNFMAVLGERVIHPPAHVRKMAWLMPKMAKAVPFLGYVIVAGNKPARAA